MVAASKGVCVNLTSTDISENKCNQLLWCASECNLRCWIFCFLRLWYTGPNMCNSDKWAENLLCHLGWNVAMMNGLIVWAGWNLMGLFDGLKNLWAEMHVSSHVGHVIITFHVSTTSSAMSVPRHPLCPRQWPCHRPCHKTCGHCVTWQLNPWR